MPTASAEPPDGSSGAGLHLPLSARLAIALGGLLTLLAAVLVFYVVPRTRGAFSRHGEELLREGTETMRELATQQTASTSTVLIDLIRHTAAARRSTLLDLPIEIFGGDVGAIRSAIAEEDAQRSGRQQRNVEVLATEMQRRAERRIDRHLRELGLRQREQTASFAEELRTTHLTLVAAALALLLLVLGLGLHWSVVRPTLRLRRATQRVALGDLAVDLPPATGDELGELTSDFAAMVGQLRESRAAQQRLTEGLAQEVQKQTQHLEQALADLRGSHAQLAAAERLAALGTLAGGIAHEFHNVIGGIRGCAAELLTEEIDGDRRETFAVILRAADRATGIVQQLLRFARRSVDQAADVDVATVVADALRLCEPAARRQNVQIDRQLPTGWLVHGDSDGLHQVFVNLLTNALQAMPNGGTLRVAVARHVVQGTAWIEVTVADTGQGITAEDLPHVFEPFFTTRDRDPDPARRGTGLGLSVSYGLVAAHRGSIRVQSVPEAGATFVVALPEAGPRT